MDKSELDRNLLASWRETQRYQVRPAGTRRAFVVGAERGNIGGSIAQLLDAENITPIWVSLSDDFDGTVPRCWHRDDLADCDVLVLANGMNWMNWIEDQTSGQMRATLMNTLYASMLGTQVFVDNTIGKPYLKYIVYIGSMGGSKVLNASAPYCAAKAGLQHFARCMAYELTPKGYRVICINPSNVEDTPMTERTIKGIARYRGISEDEARDYWSQGKRLPQWVQPMDIAALVIDFVSGARDYLSGANIDMAAGQR